MDRSVRRAAFSLVLLLTACANVPQDAPDYELNGTAPPSASGDNGNANQDDKAPASSGMPDDGVPSPVLLPALPLHTEGRSIVDSAGKRFKLASVNWYGADMKDYVVAGLDHVPLASIARTIRTMGFNSVRLPWSNEMVEKNPPIAEAALTMNPVLRGKRALDVFDAVIDALAKEGLVVILTNFISRADACCTVTDGEGLWHTTAYPEASWLADWRTLVKRYASRPSVVGAELRHDVRNSNGQVPVWGGNNPNLDWHAAAQRGGNAVLAENPNLLVVVDGLNIATDLRGVRSLPVALQVPNHLVYTAHDWFGYHGGLASYTDLKTTLDASWGYIATPGMPYTAPVWVSEFGTCNTGEACVNDASGRGFWFQSFSKYLVERDLDWGYFAVNGTQAAGTGRTFGAPEPFGVLDATWSKAVLPSLTNALLQLAPAKPAL